MRFSVLAARWSRSGLDALLFAVGALMGVLSFAYPFGHDQGVHYYVAREWLLRGAIPYRDTFDYKTPGIFVLHAIAIVLFGEHTWGIRVLELACVACLGVIVAGLLDGYGRRGFVGLCCLVTFVLYFGYFTFWDGAQCEIWAASFAAGAILAARSKRFALAGALASFAFLMKPPGLLLALPVGWYFSSRRDLVRAAGGFIAPVALTVGYFAARGGLGAMLDILVGADAQYVLGTRLVSSPGDLYEKCVDLVCWFHPFGALLVALALGAIGKGVAERRMPDLPREQVALAVLATLAVAIQLKFYRYHYAVLVLPLALGVAYLARRVVPERPGVAAVVVLALYGISGVPSRNWLWDQRSVLRYVSGNINAEELAARFKIPALAYDAHDSETIGWWVRDHSRADEPLMVRTFQPEIYAYAKRRAPGRFFWSTPIMDAKRSYKRDAWRAEDDRAIATQPRFVVTANDATGADAVSRFVSLGWERCHASGHLVVLARPRSTECDAL